MSEEPKKKPSGRFEKGDPRINRKGRPKSADEFRGLALEVLNEIATDKAGNPIIINGKKVTNLEMMIRGMMKDQRHWGDLLDRTFGKPKSVEDSDQSVEVVVRHESAEPKTDA